MSRFVSSLIFLCGVLAAGALPHRSLLSIFGNKDCETQFGDSIRKHLPAGEGVYHCFRNHVSCIDYHLRVQYPMNSKLLVVIAERQSVQDISQNPEDERVLQNYLEHTVCKDSSCKRRINVDSSKHYSLVVINANFSRPEFNESSGDSVEYVLDLYGCLTTTQKIVIVAIVICSILAVCGCLSCIIVYFRRSSRMAIAQQHQGYTYNGGDEKPIQMVATQPTHSMAPTPPMLSSQGHLNGSGVHMHTQSAIPWATPVSPSVQSSGAPRF